MGVMGTEKRLRDKVDIYLQRSFLLCIDDPQHSVQRERGRVCVRARIYFVLYIVLYDNVCIVCCVKRYRVCQRGREILV